MSVLRKAMTQFFSMHGVLFRYSLSFTMLSALFPTLIIAVLLLQNNIVDASGISEVLYQYLPESLIKPFLDYLMSKKVESLPTIVISFIVTCVLASKSLYSLMLISSSTESFTTYKILIRMKSYLLFIICVGIIGGIAIVSNIASLPIHLTFLIGLFVTLYTMYRMLSFKCRDAFFGCPGALFSSITIVLIGMLFFELSNRFMSYQSIYGPLSSLMTLVLVIYIISSVLYFGYCLNYAFVKDGTRIQFKSQRFYSLGEKVVEILSKKKRK